MTAMLKLDETIALLSASVAKDRKRQAVQRQIQHDGDAVLFAWGDAKRAGQIEAIRCARPSAIGEGGPSARVPGTHSDPVLAAILAADRINIGLALLVDAEVEWWRGDRNTRLWAQIADGYYATAGHATNGSVARALKVSERVVERCRAQMRRMVLMAARRSGAEV